MRTPSVLLLSIPLTMALATSACGDSGGADGGDETAGSETAETGTGDEIGDEMGDGDGDTTTTGDGDGDTTDTGCPVGSEGCPCTAGGGCDPGLMCESGVCVPEAGTTGDGDGDTTGDGDGDTTGDGDGDTTGDGDGDTTGDGDGDGDTTTGGLCDMDVYIEIDADDAVDSPGWGDAMSMIAPEEGDILVIENENDNNITWEVDVPCEDTYHVWVRGWEQGNQDSFFAQTDGEPAPGLIFELDCTQGPNQSHYLWKELNQRELNAGPCEYINDPWTQDWAAGVHTVSLQYRESQAVSAIVVTNLPDPPPEP